MKVESSTLTINIQRAKMDYTEIKKTQKLLRKHHDAYSIGLNSDSSNTYSPSSEKFQAFNIGRSERIRKIQRKAGK